MAARFLGLDDVVWHYRRDPSLDSLQFQAHEDPQC